MVRFIKCAAASATAAMLCFAGAANAQARDPYVRLTSEYLGTGMALDVGQISPTNNNWWAAMGPTGTGSGQLWYFAPLGGNQYRMSNQYNGLNACLDVHAEGTLYMDACGNQIGQRWIVQGQPGAIAITNALVPGHCLDVISTGAHQVAMLTPCANLTGQRWTLHNTGIYP